jgi:6-phosphogluconolactonase (cycloisomerase 2 family)
MTLFKQSAVSCAASFLLLGMSLQAEAVIYTASNEAAGNRVIAFDVDKRTGRLTELGSFDTQGTGTGAPIGNQAALATDASDRWLFVTNAGDGSVTSFRLQENGLQFVNRVDSGGHSPISVTVFGTLVYVLNEGSGDPADAPAFRYDNISGLRFNPSGELVPIPGSTRIIDNTQLTAPAQVGFNKSGTVLLITEKATDTLTTFVMRGDGTPADSPLKRPSAVPTPFGFEFGDRDFVFITEANGGGPGVTASYRINRGTGEVSSLVDLVDMGNATCWTVLSSDQTVGYSVNTGSDSLSLYRINFNGTMEPFFSRPDRQILTGGDAPRDAVLTQDNQFLFVLNNGDGELQGFRVVSDGRVVRGGPPVAVPTSVTGLVSR